MSDPYLGEIRLFGFNFAPLGWAFCMGQLVPIQQNMALFSLLGTMYGGNGTSTFALPNLQSRMVIGQGTGPGLSPYSIGQLGGEENHSLSILEMPQHNHPMAVNSGQGTVQSPGGNYLAAAAAAGPAGFSATTDTYLASGATPVAGGSQPHNNLPPYLAMNYCIALQGIFPSRN